MKFQTDKLIGLALVFFFNTVFAQVPDTDIWLFKINKLGALESGSNITNRPGYDNQPSFSQNGNLIYYTSINESKQADIMAYDVKSKKSSLVTNTKESEYSPVEMKDKNAISAVRVLADSSQIIQLFDIKSHSVIPSPISKTDSVGYYLYLNQDTVVYYKLTQPHSLRIHAVNQDKDDFICNDPIRTFKKINRYEFLFGIKDSISTAYFRFDTRIKKAVIYARINKVCEDIFWSEKYGLLISDGASILRYQENEKKWQLLFDLGNFGIKKITRFCFDPKHKLLVVVNNL